MSSKTKNNILILGISLTVLLVIFLSLPNINLGLYSSESSFKDNVGVRFNGKITNAPKSGINNDSYLETESPTINNTYTTSLSHYSTTANTVTQNTSTLPNRRENFGISSVAIPSVGQSGNYADKTNSNGTNALGLSVLSFANSRKTNFPLSSQTPEFSSLSEEFIAVSEIRNRQSAGGVDPGDDPTDPVLPLGDGFWILLTLASGYLVWKIKFTNPLIEK